MVNGARAGADRRRQAPRLRPAVDDALGRRWFEIEEVEERDRLRHRVRPFGRARVAYAGERPCRVEREAEVGKIGHDGRNVGPGCRDGQLGLARDRPDAHDLAALPRQVGRVRSDDDRAHAGRRAASQEARQLRRVDVHCAGDNHQQMREWRGVAEKAVPTFTVAALFDHGSEPAEQLARLAIGRRDRTAVLGAEQRRRMRKPVRPAPPVCSSRFTEDRDDQVTGAVQGAGLHDKTARDRFRRMRVADDTDHAAGTEIDGDGHQRVGGELLAQRVGPARQRVVTARWGVDRDLARGVGGADAEREEVGVGGAPFPQIGRDALRAFDEDRERGMAAAPRSHVGDMRAFGIFTDRFELTFVGGNFLAVRRPATAAAVDHAEHRHHRSEGHEEQERRVAEQREHHHPHEDRHDRRRERQPRLLGPLRRSGQREGRRFVRVGDARRAIEEQAAVAVAVRTGGGRARTLYAQQRVADLDDLVARQGFGCVEATAVDERAVRRAQVFDGHRVVGHRQPGVAAGRLLVA